MPTETLTLEGLAKQVAVALFGEYGTGIRVNTILAALEAAVAQRDRELDETNKRWLEVSAELAQIRATEFRARKIPSGLVFPPRLYPNRAITVGVRLSDLDKVFAALDAREAAAEEPLTKAMHASAPAGYRCSDCTIDKEPCPACYAAHWRARHPNVTLAAREAAEPSKPEPPALPLGHEFEGGEDGCAYCYEPESAHKPDPSPGAVCIAAPTDGVTGVDPGVSRVDAREKEEA